MRDLDDFDDFATGYFRRFAGAVERLDRRPLAAAAAVLAATRERGGSLWIGGNGGSCAVADHAVCDLTKTAHVPGRRALRCISMVSNGPILTALANDLGYDEVFEKQLEYGLEARDAVLLISSSGNSPNVVRACRYAKSRGVPTIAFVGFAGGELGSLADHTVWVPIDDYGVVEDLHQSLIHVLAQYFRQAAAGS